VPVEIIVDVAGVIVGLRVEVKISLTSYLRASRSVDSNLSDPPAAPVPREYQHRETELIVSFQ